MQLNVVWQLAPVMVKVVRSHVIFPYKLVIKKHSVMFEGNPILFNFIVARGLLKILAYHSLPKY